MASVELSEEIVAFDLDLHARNWRQDPVVLNDMVQNFFVSTLLTQPLQAGIVVPLTRGDRADESNGKKMGEQRGCATSRVGNAGNEASSR